MYKKIKRKDWPNFMYIVKSFDSITLTVNVFEMCEDNWEKSIEDLIKEGKVTKKIYETYIKVPNNEKDKRFEKQFSRDLMADDWEIVK